MLVIIYLPDQHKTQQMSKKVFEIGPGMLTLIPNHYKTKKTC